MENKASFEEPACEEKGRQNHNNCAEDAVPGPNIHELSKVIVTKPCFPLTLVLSEIVFYDQIVVIVVSGLALFLQLVPWLKAGGNRLYPYSLLSTPHITCTS